jgi:hypothetical protein
MKKTRSKYGKNPLQLFFQLPLKITQEYLMSQLKFSFFFLPRVKDNNNECDFIVFLLFLFIFHRYSSLLFFIFLSASTKKTEKNSTYHEDLSSHFLVSSLFS